MAGSWIADRMHLIDASGIRKVFDLAATMKNPVNLSIGQPHFDTPEPVRKALHEAVESRKNAYSPSQGISPLRQRLQDQIQQQYQHPDREVFITSGTSGGLMLALMSLVNPGEEVIVFDPYFVMYAHQTRLCAGTVRLIDTYPDFRIDLNRVADAISPRTKLILCNSPANPTGQVATEEELKGLALLAKERNIALVSDEIYSLFTYGSSHISPAKWNDQTIVIDGFSKSHSMTGLRLGWCHGPSEIMQQMIKLQQFTFVCSPHPVQWAGLAALDCDMSEHVADYHRKRDFMVRELGDLYEVPQHTGAFYLFLPVPWGTDQEFVAEALRNELLIIPGSVFSARNTHFRLSYAASDETLARGVEILRKIAKR